MAPSSSSSSKSSSSPSDSSSDSSSGNSNIHSLFLRLARLRLPFISGPVRFSSSSNAFWPPQIIGLRSFFLLCALPIGDCMSNRNKCTPRAVCVKIRQLRATSQSRACPRPGRFYSTHSVSETPSRCIEPGELGGRRVWGGNWSRCELPSIQSNSRPPLNGLMVWFFSLGII